MDKFQDYVAGREEILQVYLNYTLLYIQHIEFIKLNIEYLNFSKFYN